ncbi:family 20 glycosylhydrolase [Streptomyces monticola]|uniref:Family 20 glycosylhydrolase n=1 Tax=Streptomyces monticola TaxID=2666263 RepID=A0ABW2JW36_9ACTN
MRTSFTAVPRLFGALVVLVVLALLTALPGPLARAAPAAGVPKVLPALGNWSPSQGTYRFEADRTRIVAEGRTARRTAETLREDLRAAEKGRIPVVGGVTPRPGDVVIGVAEGRKGELRDEGYELRTAGGVARITAATEAGAFYGTRTLLQLLAQGDSVPAGTTVDIPRYKERGVGVCACYIHITAGWLENLVRDMAYHKLNHLLLELKVKSERHPEANSWGYYTRQEIRRLVAVGEKYHVTIVPEINSPGHMDPWLEHRTDLQLTDSDGKAQPSRLDVTKDEAFAYYSSLVDEYAEVFKAPYWHMGADEYMLGSDFAKYPHILEYAREKYGPGATPQDAFIDFVNRVHAHAASKGKRLRIWNDGLTGDHTVPVRPGTTVEHWLKVKTTPGQLRAQGYPLMNASYSLYLVRGGFHMDTAKLYGQQWDPRSFEGEKLDSAAGITGAKISLWPDNGRAETENEVAASLRMPLRFLAQTTWGAARPDPAYAAFTARAGAVGSAPGLRDLTRVPVPDGTYTLRDSEGRIPAADWTVTRTPDGYATLKNAATGRCAETRSGRLTLNTPLEPGSSVTQETCDPANTLQRWDLERAGGGLRLTNALTRMSVHLADDGRLVQYPSDQRPPAVWKFTPTAR